MAMPHLERIRAAPWFKVAESGGQLFRSLNLEIIRRAAVDIETKYEAPITAVYELRRRRVSGFWWLLHRAQKDPIALVEMVRCYFKPGWLFGSVDWNELKEHLGGPEDPLTLEPISPRADYRRIAEVAVCIAMRVNKLSDLGLVGFRRPFDDVSVGKVRDVLRRVIRLVVRHEAYGPRGEGKYRNRKRIYLDENSDRVVETNFGAMSGKISKEHYPEYSPGAEAELVALESESEFPKSINLDTLSPAERNAVVRVFDGFRSGYTLDGKRNDSMIEFLGNDYGRVTRAFERARKRLLKGEP